MDRHLIQRTIFNRGSASILIAATALFAGACFASPVVIRSGNVVGSPAPGNMRHHILQTQHDFAKLVAIETDGEVDLQILERQTGGHPGFPYAGNDRRRISNPGMCCPVIFSSKGGWTENIRNSVFVSRQTACRKIPWIPFGSPIFGPDRERIPGQSPRTFPGRTQRQHHLDGQTDNSAGGFRRTSRQR